MFKHTNIVCQSKVKLRMMKYWSKILSGKDTKFSYRMYFVLYCLHKNNKFVCKWISCVEKIFQNVGLNYICMNNDVTNVNWLCTEVQKRLQLKFIQNWHSNIQESPKCLNYSNFKTEFTTELYITKLQPSFHIPLARFRTTSNRFPVEKGRWENTEQKKKKKKKKKNN